MDDRHEAARNGKTGLARADREARHANTWKKEALANYQDVPDTAMADLFVVFLVNEAVWVRSTGIMLEPSASAFSQYAHEWAMVELRWWAEDHNEDAAIDALLQTVAPQLYHIDVDHEALIPLNDALYGQALVSSAKKERQFALLSRDTPEKAIDIALRNRIYDIHGWHLPHQLQGRGKSTGL